MSQTSVVFPMIICATVLHPISLPETSADLLAGPIRPSAYKSCLMSR